MINPQIKITLLLTLVVAVILAVIYWPKNHDLKRAASTQPNSEVVPSRTKETSSIANEWQWTNESDLVTNKVNSAKELPFTASSVYQALQAVKLDEEGNVILDHDALLSLDETLERIHTRLDSDSIELLKDLIKQALPGKAGEQTAELVGNYYHFLGAKQEFSQINEAMVESNDAMTSESIEANETLYNELQALRDVHLGSDSTKKLFRVSDANARYMFNSMKLENNDLLTEPEKLSRRQEIQQQFIAQGINISEWPARYSQFKQAKQSILESALLPQQKQEKLEELLTRSFSEEELKRINHLKLGQI
jgi:hypothetical protein